jgi:hypothetical protein
MQTASAESRFFLQDLRRRSIVPTVGFYSPNHQNSRWGGLLSMGAPDSPVRQPRHPTIRVLTVSIVGALTAWCTGQSGAPFGAALTLHGLFTHCSLFRRPLESTVALGSRCSAGTPDSPVNYSGARTQKPEGEEFEVDPPWCTRHCPVEHQTVQCVKPGFSSVSFAPFF